MPDKLILRDVLALDRTSLANERTLLAYIRTAVGLVAGGFGLTQIMPDTWAFLTGWGTVLVGLLTASAGIARFIVVRRHIMKEMEIVPPK
ncbi:MAG: DUF202 domain-containing protein [Deltaproteobacteria bacterium]|nr:MAG: DUF202 domain-containing protein [Deltaproteobacteria bacterium]